MTTPLDIIQLGGNRIEQLVPEYETRFPRIRLLRHRVPESRCGGLPGRAKRRPGRIPAVVHQPWRACRRRLPPCRETMGDCRRYAGRGAWRCVDRVCAECPPTAIGARHRGNSISGRHGKKTPEPKLGRWLPLRQVSCGVIGGCTHLPRLLPDLCLPRPLTNCRGLCAAPGS